MRGSSFMGLTLITIALPPFTILMVISQMQVMCQCLGRLYKTAEWVMVAEEALSQQVRSFVDTPDPVTERTLTLTET